MGLVDIFIVRARGYEMAPAEEEEVEGGAGGLILVVFIFINGDIISSVSPPVSPECGGDDRYDDDRNRFIIHFRKAMKICTYEKQQPPPYIHLFT